MFCVILKEDFISASLKTLEVACNAIKKVKLVGHILVARGN
jgi:hypothetical protein